MIFSRSIFYVTIFLIISMMGVSGGSIAGLPEKSEWLPGAIKRDDNGNLYLETVDTQNEAVNSPVKKTRLKSPKKPDTNKATILHQNWVELSWEVPSESMDVAYSKPQLSSVAGFNVYYWTKSNSKKIKRDVKKNIKFKINDLSYGETYFFAVTSYSDMGIESVFSQTIIVLLKEPVVTN